MMKVSYTKYNFVNMSAYFNSFSQFVLFCKKDEFTSANNIHVEIRGEFYKESQTFNNDLDLYKWIRAKIKNIYDVEAFI